MNYEHFESPSNLQEQNQNEVGWSSRDSLTLKLVFSSEEFQVSSIGVENVPLKSGGDIYL